MNYLSSRWSNQSFKSSNGTTAVRHTNATSSSAANELPLTNAPVNQSFPKRVAVLIVTAKRSGSSFVGDLFNQHPDVFYVYEPLWSLNTAALTSYFLKKTFLKTSIGILKRALHCDFHTGYPKQVLQKGTQFCFKNAKIPRNRSYCNYAKWEEMCKKYKLVVLKVIRVHNLNDIRPLVAATDIELRVIHLVRDPRPTELSRMRTKPNLDLIRRKGTDANDVEDLCNTLEQNVNFSKDLPPWMEGKYKLVRFEDIAASPQKVTEELYDFAGLTVIDKIGEWIKENTEAKNESSSAFGTRRNTSKVLDAWRHKMRWELITKIQKSCLNAMEALGYVVFPDLESLQDTNHPSTLPLRHL